jgi:hypothetical protein
VFVEKAYLATYSNLWAKSNILAISQTNALAIFFARDSEDFSDALTGHANPNVGRQYGNKIGKRDATDFLGLLKSEIDRIEFDVP